MTKKISAFFIIVFAISVCYGQEKVRVAVMETLGTADAAKREEIRNALTDGILNNKNFILVERAALNQLMKEKALQASDNFDENTQVELGKMAGAKYICVSSFNSANGYEYRLTYRLVDVETGETLEGTRVRENISATDFYSVIDRISDSKLFSQDIDNSNTFNASVCGCEIQKEDLPDGVKIPEGWRLPTIKELKCICENKDKIGGFNFGTYKSSTKEKGYNKGIKFQFCDEVFITGSASIRLVRSIGDTAQYVEEKKETEETPKSSVSEKMDKVKSFVKKKSESENKPDEASEQERIKQQQEQKQVEQKRQQEIAQAKQERLQKIEAAKQEELRKIEAAKQERKQAEQVAQNLKEDKRHNMHGVQISANGLIDLEGLDYGKGFEFVAGYRLNPFFFFGGGIGYYKYDDYDDSHYIGSGIPLFGNFRWNMTKTMFSPYIELSGGVCFDSYSRDYEFWSSSPFYNYTSYHKEYNETIFYYSATAGFDMKFNDRFSLNIGVGYNNVLSQSASISLGFTYTFNRYQPAKQ